MLHVQLKGSLVASERVIGAFYLDSLPVEGAKPVEGGTSSGQDLLMNDRASSSFQLLYLLCSDGRTTPCKSSQEACERVHTVLHMISASCFRGLTHKPRHLGLVRCFVSAQVAITVPSAPTKHSARVVPDRKNLYSSTGLLQLKNLRVSELQAWAESLGETTHQGYVLVPSCPGLIAVD